LILTHHQCRYRKSIILQVLTALTGAKLSYTLAIFLAEKG